MTMADVGAPEDPRPWDRCPEHDALVCEACYFGLGVASRDAEVAALRAEVERLTRERDHMRDKWHESNRAWWAMEARAKESEADRDQARRELVELRERVVAVTELRDVARSRGRLVVELHALSRALDGGGS